MRTLLTSALVLLACGFAGSCADRSSRSNGASAPLAIPDGPDPIVLKVEQSGGFISAAHYPALDSIVWRSSARAQPLERIIAFGSEDGYLAAEDRNGQPVRIDLRIGTVSTRRGETMQSLSSADGSTVYGISRNGSITRFTLGGGDWTLEPAHPVDAMLPQQDGSVILVGAEPGSVTVRRIRPPNKVASDSVILSGPKDPSSARKSIAATAVASGDRIYMAFDERVIAIRARDLGIALDIDLGDPVKALAATPSGDRVFVALDGKAVLRIVDRFEESVTGRVRLSANAQALRMDAMGRFLIAHVGADSVEIVDVSDGNSRGVVASQWRQDLPLVMPDGAIAVTRGSDVAMLNPWTMAEVREVKNGSKYFWYSIRWNGFRPRSAGLDQPVEFRSSEPRDSSYDSSWVSGDTAGRPADNPDSASRVVTDSSAAESRRGVSRDRERGAGGTGGSQETGVFSISFAALLDERQARALASRIRIEGHSARLTFSERDGTTIYRVVMGPFSTRAEAERIARMSGRDYWVFEGTP